MKKETFRDRLKQLMGRDRPYSWSKKVGIEKGLFQYYWQRGKTPTYHNLLKIQAYSGCSLDWLLTGKSVHLRKVDKNLELPPKTPDRAQRTSRLEKAAEKLHKIYEVADDKDIEFVEHALKLLSKYEGPSSKSPT